MKNAVSTLILIFFCFTVVAQWENVGQVIYGESEGDAAGFSVSINGAGDRIAVYDLFPDGDVRGRVRVFELVNGTWEQLGEGIHGLSGQESNSAGYVVLSNSGNRFVFGSPLNETNGELSGAVRVFEYQAGSWSQIGQTLYGVAAGDLFGVSVDMSFDGNVIAVGANQDGLLTPGVGYMSVYEYQSDTWTLKGSVISGLAIDDLAGQSISLAMNGDRVALAAPWHDSNGANSGHIRIFDFDGNDWVQVGSDILGETEGDEIGYTLGYGASAIDFNQSGSRIALGSMGHKLNGFSVGQVRVFELQGNIWNQLGTNINGLEHNDLFSNSVGLNGAGNILVVGDPQANSIGETIVYRFENNDWVQFGDTMSGDNIGDWAGYCSELNALGNRLIIGAWFNDAGGLNAGKVDVFYDDAILSVDDIAFDQSVVLYPNPNRNSFSIYFQHNPQNVTISIVDVAGKRVYSEKITAQENISIDHNLDAGIYFVKLTSNTSEATLKMVVE